MATVAFSFGSTTLATYGKVTLINDYLDIPERRGENQVIPYRHGTVFAKKYFGERKMTFGMAITAATATALETKFDTMRAKFAPLTQQTLSVTLESGAIRTVNATVDRPIEVDRKTNTLAFVVVEFTLANPIWRSNTLYTVDSDAIDGTPTPQTLTVVNGGTLEERDPVLVLYGPLENPVITNTTPTVPVILTYTGVIDDGETVTIQTATTGEYTAVYSKGATSNVIGNVTHSGSAALMVFEVGNNAVTIADANYEGGNAKLTVSFYTPFL
jgi:hypothetical protein